MKIEVFEGSKPIIVNYGRRSKEDMDFMRENIQELLYTGVIQLSTSSYATEPFINKKDGRIVFDFRGLNIQTKDLPFPMPVIEVVINKMGKAKYFKKLDLKSGYHQLLLRGSDRGFTAFKFEGRLYEFTRVPFGLKNAPAWFNRWIQFVLRGFSEFAAAYIDDIVNIIDDHFKHIKMVLSKFMEEGIYLNVKKCRFFASEVEFCGHRISTGGVKVKSSKVEAIAQLSIKVRSFLGACNYYRKFIPNYVELTHRLTELTKKNIRSRIELDESVVDDIKKLKDALMSAPLLKNYQLLKEAPHRVIRWLDLISKFDFEIRHISGKENYIADMLSRDAKFYLDWDIQFTNMVKESYKNVIDCDKVWLDSVRLRDDVEEVDGILYVNDTNTETKRMVLVDKRQITSVLDEAHSTIYAGHPGVIRLNAKVRPNFFFPQFTKRINSYVKLISIKGKDLMWRFITKTLPKIYLSICPHCTSFEDSDHIFFNCLMIKYNAKRIWYQILELLGRDKIKWDIMIFNKLDDKVIGNIAAIIFNQVWYRRNKKRHNGLTQLITLKDIIKYLKVVIQVIWERELLQLNKMFCNYLQTSDKVKIAEDIHTRLEEFNKVWNSNIYRAILLLHLMPFTSPEMNFKNNNSTINNNNTTRIIITIQ